MSEFSFLCELSLNILNIINIIIHLDFQTKHFTHFENVVIMTFIYFST